MCSVSSSYFPPRVYNELACIPVLSTLKAKFPLPTCSGVVLLSMRVVRTTLYRETIACLYNNLVSHPVMNIYDY